MDDFIRGMIIFFTFEGLIVFGVSYAVFHMSPQSYCEGVFWLEGDKYFVSNHFDKDSGSLDCILRTQNGNRTEHYQVEYNWWSGVHALPR